MGLIFSITQEKRKGEVFLVLYAQSKDKGSFLSLAELKKTKDIDGSLIELLSQKKSFEEGGQIFIGAAHSLAVLHKLILAKVLLWKERTLFFNPLSKTEVRLEAESMGEGEIFLTGSLLLDGVSYSAQEVDFLFPAVPVWGICKQRVFALSKEVKFSWLLALQEKELLLTKQESSHFIEEYKEDPPDGFPTISWKGFSSVQNALLPVFPILVLKDQHGAFADLKMEYGEKVVDFLDEIAFFGRDKKAEQGWEKDLLETGFIRKSVGTSSYYCPMDQVAKSLSFLWEIGWKIQDSKGRVILRVTGSEKTLTTVGDKLLVKGHFQYEKHTVDLTNVIGAFTRREKFLELAPDAVAWLGDSMGYEGVDDLLGGELTKEGCSLRKRQFGLLEQCGNLQADQLARPLLDRLQARQPLLAEEDPFFQGVLHPYQQQGKEWLLFLQQNGFSGLLADEMGLGKTIQTLSFLSGITWLKPILIVVPTSLVFNWRREWEAFIPHKTLYVYGEKERGDKNVLEKKQVILTSYSYLRIEQELFSSIDFSIIVLDEAQRIKNPDSQLARAAYQLRSDMRLCLSGTPIENRVDDLWSLFHFLEPELLGERKNFTNTLQIAEADDRYRQQIRKKIAPFLKRRTKEEVALDLPEKFHQVIYVEMSETQRRFYENWLNRTRVGLANKGNTSSRIEILEAILRLRQICAEPLLVDGDWAEGQEETGAKVERVCADLEEIIEQKQKVLVYSQFTSMLTILKKQAAKRGWRYVYLDGETKDREAVVSLFQEDPTVSLFFISLKAGGVGLNLTAADYVFLFDPWWNEAVECQAIDRAHRLGRKGTVVARRYIMAESVEEKMMKIKAHKATLAKGLLDLPSQEAEWSLSDLMALLN